MSRDRDDVASCGSVCVQGCQLVVVSWIDKYLRHALLSLTAIILLQVRSPARLTCITTHRVIELVEKVKQSVATVRPSVCLSVRLYLLYLLNRLTFKLHGAVACMCMDHEPRSPGIEIQGHKSRLRLGL